MQTFKSLFSNFQTKVGIPASKRESAANEPISANNHAKKQGKTQKAVRMAQSQKKVTVKQKPTFSDRWVDDGVAFWCSNGQVFHSLKELIRGMSEMTEETFRSHSNVEKCDFSSWVRDVFLNSELANSLWGVRTNRSKTLALLKQRVAS